MCAVCRLIFWSACQVAGLMGVVQCCFAGVGTQLFGHVRRGQPGGITRSVNFETFGNSMLILFQCMTSALHNRFYPVLALPWLQRSDPCSRGVHLL